MEDFKRLGPLVFAQFSHQPFRWFFLTYHPWQLSWNLRNLPLCSPTSSWTVTIVREALLRRPEDREGTRDPQQHAGSSFRAVGAASATPAAPHPSGGSVTERPRRPAHPCCQITGFAPYVVPTDTPCPPRSCLSQGIENSWPETSAWSPTERKCLRHVDHSARADGELGISSRKLPWYR